ncbi:MAG: hypothetical protein DRG78_08205 [Epsilonproteobacteria bacterium]|nr:MAG: hypothetical protein DRG78_08205 [Campylobacterota bacterium]
MKTLTKLFLILTLGVTLIQAAAYEKDAKYRTIKVHISAEKPVTAGTNTLHFSITKDGKAIKDSKVSLKAFMPAMPGMPAMVSKVDASYIGNGVYEAKLNLAMSGTWQLHIFIAPKKGKKSRVKTTINF